MHRRAYAMLQSSTHTHTHTHTHTRMHTQAVKKRDRCMMVPMSPKTTSSTWAMVGCLLLRNSINCKEMSQRGFTRQTARQDLHCAYSSISLNRNNPNRQIQGKRRGPKGRKTGSKGKRAGPKGRRTGSKGRGTGPKGRETASEGRVCLPLLQLQRR